MRSREERLPNHRRIRASDWRFPLLVLGVLAALALLPLVAHGTETESLAWKRIQLSGLPEHEGQRLLGSDGIASYVLLAGTSPSLHRVSVEGVSELVYELDSPLWAVNQWAVGDEGSLIVARTGVHRLQVFEDGESVEFEDPTWMVAGVAATGGNAIVALAPVRFESAGGSDLAAGGAAFSPTERPPAIVRLSGKEWRTLVNEIPEPRIAGSGGRLGLRGRETWLAGSSGGRLLHTRRAAYDVRVFSDRGKQVSRLQALGGEAQIEEVSLASLMDADDAKAVSNLDQKQRDEVARRGTEKRQRVRTLVVGLGFSPDGSPHVVTRGKGVIEIDRYVAPTGFVERCTVDGIEVRSLRASLDREGLWVWPAALQRHAYFISWESLAGCEWSESRDVSSL